MDVLGKQKDMKVDDKISSHSQEPPTVMEDGYGVYDQRPKPIEQQILRA